MIEVFKTNDPVRLSYAEAILREAGIEPVVLDAQTAGLFGGALPWIKRRMLVAEDSAERAKELLDAAFAGDEEA